MNAASVGRWLRGRKAESADFVPVHVVADTTDAAQDGRLAGTYDRGEALHGSDEGQNERQSRTLDPESSGITSESKVLLSD